MICLRLLALLYKIPRRGAQSLRTSGLVHALVGALDARIQAGRTRIPSTTANFPNFAAIASLFCNRAPGRIHRFAGTEKSNSSRRLNWRVCGGWRHSPPQTSRRQRSVHDSTVIGRSVHLELKQRWRLSPHSTRHHRVHFLYISMLVWVV